MARTAAAKSITFTDKFIAGLKPTDARYFKREARGFAIRVMPSGLKTWFYIYTWKGLRKHMNLGAYPGVILAEARQRYTAAYSMHQQGNDPNPDKEGESCTSFRHFSELFLASIKKSTSKKYHTICTQAMQNDILPYWGEHEVTDIKRRDAITLLERVAARSPGQTYNVQRAASGVLSYAVERDYLEYNVMFRLAKAVPELKYVPRDRVLTDEEIRHIWTELKEDTRNNKALRLVLVTAQRPGEVSGMHRREINGDTWTIPKERMKMKAGDHIVHLTPTALELIGDAEGYIFPMVDVEEAMDTKGLSTMVNRKDCNGTRQGIRHLPYYGIPRWTPHDLRRTARTNMSRIRIPSEHAEAVIAHAKPGIQKVYDQWEYLEEKREALQKWEALLLDILNDSIQ